MRREARREIDGVTLVWDEWGAADAPPVVCVHGLTRNARDFDALAEALAPQRRVIALDVAGRGRSGRLADPASYQNPVYAVQILKLLDTLGLPRVDWVGTSMGGLIGMIVAATASGRIRRLVLNDVGAFIPRAALARIGEYLGRDRLFADMEAVEAHVRRAYAAFGLGTDEDWRRLAENSVEPAPGGGYAPAYDPAIANAFQTAAVDVALWPLWASVTVPVLLLRGAESDLLLRCTALGMVARGKVDLVEFPGVGHAPALIGADQIDPVVRWLTA